MIEEHPKIEALLTYYSQKTGVNLLAYRNHVYRVFNFAIKLDPGKENEEKYMIAAVFHDLGIWTHDTFDYLKPSKELAKKYLVENELEAWESEILSMIEMHHKRSAFQGEFEKTVENFRRADWIDVTKGSRRFRMDKEFIKQVQEQFPNEGFHRTLRNLTFKSFLLHPWNPLPMFKK